MPRTRGEPQGSPETPSAPHRQPCLSLPLQPFLPEQALLSLSPLLPASCFFLPCWVLPWHFALSLSPSWPLFPLQPCFSAFGPDAGIGEAWALGENAWF